MNDAEQQNSRPTAYRQLLLAASAIWTVAAVAILLMELNDYREFVAANALSSSRAIFAKDLTFRRWAAGHGGVYVPISENTLPNPYLNVPERDIKTPSGIPLTRLNPAYMSRQLYESARSQDDAPQGHITSLKPLRPENAPDPWEKVALQAFEKGRLEVSGFQQINGKPYFRYMHVLKTEKACLSCHAAQGYSEGDVRGGISVTLSMEEFERSLASSNSVHYMIVLAIWLSGVAGLWLAGRKISLSSRALFESEQRYRQQYLQSQETLLQLRDKTDFAENLILNSTTPTFVIDAEHRILIWNRAIEELTGMRAPEMIGTDQQWRAFYPCQRPCLADIVISGTLDQAEELYSNISPSRLIPEGLQSEGDYSLNGRICRLVFSAAPIRDRDGNIVAAIETLEDITERIMLESQLQHAQKMETVGVLVGGVAHDFNNVLTVISGYADLLQLTLADDRENLDFVLEISASVNRASEMTRSLLAFSGKQEPQLQYDDLNRILATIRKSLGRLIREDIKLSIRPAEQNLPVYVDAVQIEQVLINLVVNARDAIESGGEINVSTMSEELAEARIENNTVIPPGHYVGFCVRDNGSGMPRETLERIFDPFFTTKGKGKGTGLGLAIVSNIIARHNGFISVASNPGSGTEFRVYLPMYAGQQSRIDDGITTPLNYHGSETILLVEDDAAVMKLLHDVLKHYGYTVLTAADGLEALEIYDAHVGEIRTAIFDLIMPRMNGRELAEAIRSRCRDLPIIIMSGHSNEIVDSSAIRELGVVMLQKPVRALNLLGVIRAALQGVAGKQL